MNWIKSFKTMNWKQKKELKAKLKPIHDNVLFHVACLGLALYICLELWY